MPSEHEWLHFIDTIQYVGDDKNVELRKNDIVVGIKDLDTVLTVDMLKKIKESRTISFLKRPYGRPNRTPADERGWLYAERITVAIRMAAAKEEMFDDVVMTNEETLYLRIRKWSIALRFSASAKNREQGTTIGVKLDAFEAVLKSMKFTVPSDTTLVKEIMHNVVNRFKTNWNDETKRQKDMSRRAREILLRWGAFTSLNHITL